MTPTQKVKLKTVAEQNQGWPLVIVGFVANQSKDATIVPAIISARALHTDTIAIKPNIVIDGLDKISAAAQAKFITLLKDRRTGMRKLPADTRIFIPVESADKLSPVIKKLVLIYNA